MRNRRLIQTAVLAAAMAVTCLGAGAGMARADEITLDVSGTLTATSPTASCGAAGCTLGGTLVINNSAGAANGGFVSAYITVSGATPMVGPFTEYSFITEVPGTNLTGLVLGGPGVGGLSLAFGTPTDGSLVGYDGGPLNAANSDALGVGGNFWALTSGSLTPAATTPTAEPASFLLFGTGLIGLVLAVRKRSRQQRALRTAQADRTGPSPRSLTLPQGLAAQRS